MDFQTVGALFVVALTASWLAVSAARSLRRGPGCGRCPVSREA